MKRKLTLPSIPTAALGIIAGILAGLLGSHLLDLFGLNVDRSLAIALAAIGSITGPLSGPAFRNAIHFPKKWLPAAVAIASGIGILAAQIGDVQVQGILEGIVAFASWVLLGPGAAAGATRARNKLGRLPAVRPPGLKIASAYMTRPLPPAPAVMPVPKTGYPMDANDQYGDCTLAGVDHMIRAFNRLYGARGIRLPSVRKIVRTYFAMTGGQDTGLVVADVLKAWHAPGLFGHKIIGYAPLPVSKVDFEPLKQAIAYYGAVALGIMCPQSAQDQFAAGIPWTYDPHSPDEGGHFITGLGYTANGLLCATWGGIAEVTWALLAHKLEEAWVVIADELVAAGHDTLNIDVPTLLSDLANV